MRLLLENGSRFQLIRSIWFVWAFIYASILVFDTFLFCLSAKCFLSLSLSGWLYLDLLVDCTVGSHSHISSKQSVELAFCLFKVLLLLETNTHSSICMMILVGFGYDKRWRGKVA